MTTRDEALHNIFVTALEGGIGYWSTCSVYRWHKKGVGDDLEGFTATIQDMEDENAEYVINRDVIIKGASLYARRYGDAVHMPYFHRAATCLLYEKWDDLDVDADIADVIVQFGLFGEVVYG